jgi:hypothetical protein
MCKKWGIYTVVYLVFYLIIGCTLPWSRVQPAEDSDALKTTELLRYFHDVKSLSQEELLHLYAYEEEQLFARENDQNVLKFALLLILPDTEFQDIPRALVLLDAYLSENKYPEPLKNFAYLLSHMIREVQYQEILYEIASKELHNAVEEKEEKEKLYNNTKQKIDIILAEKKYQESLYKELHKELDKEKAIVQNLRKTIEQLKTIEKSINERKQPKAPAT